MTIAPDAAQALTGLAVGDIVVLKRDLDHPAWARQDVDEVISPRTSVMDQCEIPAVPGPAGVGGRAASALVRLLNGFWYDCATGLQADCGATVIEMPTSAG